MLKAALLKILAKHTVWVRVFPTLHQDNSHYQHFVMSNSSLALTMHYKDPALWRSRLEKEKKNATPWPSIAQLCADLPEHDWRGTTSSPLLWRGTGQGNLCFHQQSSLLPLFLSALLLIFLLSPLFVFELMEFNLK